MNEFIKRLEALEAVKTDLYKLMEQSKPFAVIRPISLVRDDFRIEEYWSGLGGNSEDFFVKSEDIFPWIESHPEYKIIFSFSGCTEWLFVNIISTGLYNDDQIEQLIREWWAKYPQETVAAIGAFDMISKIPQRMVYNGNGK